MKRLGNQNAAAQEHAMCEAPPLVALGTTTVVLCDACYTMWAKGTSCVVHGTCCLRVLSVCILVRCTICTVDPNTKLPMLARWRIHETKLRDAFIACSTTQKLQGEAATQPGKYSDSRLPVCFSLRVMSSLP